MDSLILSFLLLLSLPVSSQITSVLPPKSTLAGWNGCFGPPAIDMDIGKPRAHQVTGQFPCGNGTVESCCILGDQCMSNSVCRILPVPNSGKNESYYGAYCTDPTFTSPECTSNCRYEYMSYCGANNIWQCGWGKREQLLSCDFRKTTDTVYSTFFMIEPTKLAYGSVLPTAATTTIQHFIPTQWGVPTAGSVSSSTSQEAPSPVITPASSASSMITAPSATESPDTGAVGTILSFDGRVALISGLALGIPTFLAAIIVGLWKEESRAAIGKAWRFIKSCFRVKVNMDNDVEKPPEYVDKEWI